MPALGSAERAADIYAERLSQRVLAYEGVMQKDKPIAQAHLAEARVRLRALRGLLADTVGEIETLVATGDPVPRPVRGEARLAAAHIVHESRAVVYELLEASGASAHFLDNPLQRIKRDIDVICGHVVFDYDTSRELAGSAHTGHEGATDRNGLKGFPWPDDTRDRITNFFQKRVANPLMRRNPFQTLLETTGRKSGEPRRTPLGGSRVGDQFWFVSEFGDKSQYVKNIQANPNVRVRLRGPMAQRRRPPGARRRPARAAAVTAAVQQLRRAHLRHQSADDPRRFRRIDLTRLGSKTNITFSF